MEDFIFIYYVDSDDLKEISWSKKNGSLATVSLVSINTKTSEKDATLQKELEMYVYNIGGGAVSIS